MVLRIFVFVVRVRMCFPLFFGTLVLLLNILVPSPVFRFFVRYMPIKSRPKRHEAFQAEQVFSKPRWRSFISPNNSHSAENYEPAGSATSMRQLGTRHLHSYGDCGFGSNGS